MNNTFCLGIFLVIIYVQKLAWEFSAETLSILLIEVRTAGVRILSFAAWRGGGRLF